MTTESDPVAGLIPWYAAGTLSSDERRTVERHLPGCEACRSLLELARGQKALAGTGTPGELLAHVSPRLLTQFVEAPERLEEETRAWIRSKLETCATCRQAHALLGDVQRELGRATAPTGWASRGVLLSLWEAIAGSILRPVPALGYLVALFAVTAIWLQPGNERGARRAPLAEAPVRITVHGERSTRTEAGVTETPPLDVSPSAGPLLVELETDLVASDLEDPALVLRLEVLRRDRVVWSTPRTREDFASRDGRLVTSFLLYPEQYEAEGTHGIVIRAVKPGDPIDGTALFRRSLRFVGPGGAAPPG